jgi:ribosomal protein S27E
MRVECTVQETTEDGRDAVTAECGRCGHETTSFGTSDASIRRCLVLLREECPEGEENFYVDESEE